MSDEQLPPTHQPWGSRPDQEQPPYSTPPPDTHPQQSPYGSPPNPYAQQNPYPAPPNSYGAQPYQPAYGGGGVPDHPSATTALVLGIVSLVGILMCGGLTLVLAPFAWGLGSRALRAIDASPGQFGGRDKASAGRVMGIIGSVLLVLGIIAVLGVIALLVAVGRGTGDPSPVLPSGSGFVTS